MVKEVRKSCLSVAKHGGAGIKVLSDGNQVKAAGGQRHFRPPVLIERGEKALRLRDLKREESQD